jgi:protoporphyrinogen oxidase
LHELGHENWAPYEKSADVGGHAASHADSSGFLWDKGGHVIFSHYPYFERLIDEASERVRARELDL